MLRLRTKPAGPIPLEAECIRPDALIALSVDEIAQLSIWQGNQKGRLGDFFEIEGDAADGIVEIAGDCSRVKRLGESMAGGKLVIRGNAGMHLGARMQNGSIDVFGSVDDCLGTQMAGGTIRVRGHAGDLVGAAERGASRGMTGGAILIDGHAGNEVGTCMRRGIIAIAGNCGHFAGHSMIAGTILVGGDSGPNPGAGMKRGTILVLGSIEKIAPGFTSNCEFAPNFPVLYGKYLKSLDFQLPKLASDNRYIRYVGDLVSLGKGEIIQKL